MPDYATLLTLLVGVLGTMLAFFLRNWVNGVTARLTEDSRKFEDLYNRMIKIETVCKMAIQHNHERSQTDDSKEAQG